MAVGVVSRAWLVGVSGAAATGGRVQGAAKLIFLMKIV
jgi:hypothetical protein